MGFASRMGSLAPSSHRSGKAVTSPMWDEFAKEQFASCSPVIKKLAKQAKQCACRWARSCCEDSNPCLGLGSLQKVRADITESSEVAGVSAGNVIDLISSFGVGHSGARCCSSIIIS